MVPCLKTEAKVATETSSFIKKLDDERTPINKNCISELQRGFSFCIRHPVALLYSHNIAFLNSNTHFLNSVC